ncbi:hypothetical protein GCM10007877_15970 [Marinibactrum halimedae]|uniref:Uncharacterized protein n=2 Tax=Marinibactrum halimedae TaxID=1444977 RepID=A0AA37T3G1_9GAMM|nr:hypothetical protein GCM10007877_15970 [Marinibactrum halimedae]
MTSQMSPYSLTIIKPEQDRIRFQGKGAGAGMMMMGSMGAMGIAIGVAIDEGISKDIQTSAEKEQVYIPDIVEQSLKRTLERIQGEVIQERFHSPLTLQLKIIRYGFKSAPGDQKDPVSIELQAEIISEDGAVFPLNYPFQGETVMTEELEEIKENGKLIGSIWEQSLSQLFTTKQTEFIEYLSGIQPNT